MSSLAHYAPSDLRLIYRVLHSKLMSESDLLDSQLFEDIQTHLQSLARSEGVDTSDHGQWEAWLGDKQAAPRRHLTLLKD